MGLQVRIHGQYSANLRVALPELLYIARALKLTGMVGKPTLLSIINYRKGA